MAVLRVAPLQYYPAPTNWNSTDNPRCAHRVLGRDAERVDRLVKVGVVEGDDRLPLQQRVVVPDPRGRFEA